MINLSLIYHIVLPIVRKNVSVNIHEYANELIFNFEYQIKRQ